jgi:hypothetical protein
MEGLHNSVGGSFSGGRDRLTDCLLRLLRDPSFRHQLTRSSALLPSTLLAFVPSSWKASASGAET